MTESPPHDLYFIYIFGFCQERNFAFLKVNLYKFSLYLLFNLQIYIFEELDLHFYTSI